MLSIRLGDLYVALVTLTFGLLMENLVFTLPSFVNQGLGLTLNRPSFATSDRAFTYLSPLQTLITRMIPPTLGYEVPDPELDLDYVPGEARPLLAANGGPPVAISNSFAFGGHNVALVLRGAPQ